MGKAYPFLALEFQAENTDGVAAEQLRRAAGPQRPFLGAPGIIPCGPPLKLAVRRASDAEWGAIGRD
jgi:hypothetical protein